MQILTFVLVYDRRIIVPIHVQTFLDKKTYYKTCKIVLASIRKKKIYMHIKHTKSKMVRIQVISKTQKYRYWVNVGFLKQYASDMYINCTLTYKVLLMWIHWKPG